MVYNDKFSANGTYFVNSKTDSSYTMYFTQMDLDRNKFVL